MIQHYKGQLGEFEYDDEIWEIRNAFTLFEYDDLEDDYNQKYSERLKYMGNETDGSKIHIPDGINNTRGMFYGHWDLETPPAIPFSVTDCTGMFWGCGSLKHSARIPFGVEAISDMYRGCSDLEDASVVPAGVVCANNVYYGCPKDVREQGKWNIEHPSIGGKVDNPDELCDEYYSADIIGKFDSHFKQAAAYVAMRFKESDCSPIYGHVINFINSGDDLNFESLSREMGAADNAYELRKGLSKKNKGKQARDMSVAVGMVGQKHNSEMVVESGENVVQGKEHGPLAATVAFKADNEKLGGVAAKETAAFKADDTTLGGVGATKSVTKSIKKLPKKTVAKALVNTIEPGFDDVEDEDDVIVINGKTYSVSSGGKSKGKGDMGE